MRIALSSYRSKPHCGGQGVYVRHLSRELMALGHRVEVFSGPPYPELDPSVALARIPGLDLYRDEDPFRRPALREFRDRTDVAEYAIMCTAGFPEPRTFCRRLAAVLGPRATDFDLLHDNQSLGSGLLDITAAGLPVLATVHHPITADRRVELAAATGRRRLTVRRWYGFARMQRRVARRLEHLITVSPLAAADIVRDFGVAPQRLRVIPVGVDIDTFAPPQRPRMPGRLVCIASADVTTKGLPVLLRALREVPDADLVVVGAPAPATRRLLGELGVADRVRFERGLSDAALAELLGSAALAVVPSLYEGFSLPAVEALACATPVVASAVGALPDLLGAGGGTVPDPLGESGGARHGMLVRPGDPDALAEAIRALLAAPEARARMGAAGRAATVSRYAWRSVVARTVEYYAEILAERAGAAAGPPRPPGRPSSPRPLPERAA